MKFITHVCFFVWVMYILYGINVSRNMCPFGFLFKLYFYIVGTFWSFIVFMMFLKNICILINSFMPCPDGTLSTKTEGEHNIKTLYYPLSVRCSRHCMLSGGTQYRALSRMKKCKQFKYNNSSQFRLSKQVFRCAMTASLFFLSLYIIRQ